MKFLLPTSVVPGSLQSWSLTLQDDKWHEVPQVTSVPLEPSFVMWKWVIPFSPGLYYTIHSGSQGRTAYARVLQSPQLSFSACSPSWRYNNTKYTSIRLVIICNSKLLAIPKCPSTGAGWNSIEHAHNGEGRGRKIFINLTEVISRIYCSIKIKIKSKMQKSLYSIIPFHVRNKGKPKNIQNVLNWERRGKEYTHTPKGWTTKQ